MSFWLANSVLLKSNNIKGEHNQKFALFYRCAEETGPSIENIHSYLIVEKDN